MLFGLEKLLLLCVSAKILGMKCTAYRMIVEHAQYVTMIQALNCFSCNGTKNIKKKIFPVDKIDGALHCNRLRWLRDRQTISDLQPSKRFRLVSVEFIWFVKSSKSNVVELGLNFYFQPGDLSRII